MEKIIVLPENDDTIDIVKAESGDFPIVVYDRSDELVGVCIYEGGNDVWICQIGMTLEENNTLEEIIKSCSAYTFKAIVL